MTGFKIIAALIMTSSIAYTGDFKDFLGRVNSLPDSQKTAVVDSFMGTVNSFPMIEGDTIVHFLYRGSANTITIPGDANGWSTYGYPMNKIAGTDLWYFTRVFEPDARLDYKFLLNGSNWILDPRNPNLVSGGFGANSELRMPDYPPAPEIAFYPNIPHGVLRDTVFYSTYLSNTRTIRIYTPPDYETSSDSFPVIIFHDGLEFISLAQANNVIDYLISRNRIEPVIAVFVPPVNRTAEYAGNQMNQFSSFIVDELVPFIDGRYRTKRSPLFRAVLGASNGGNISLWLGETHPDVFGNIAAQSSNVVSAVMTGFRSSPLLNLKFCVDVGTYDIQVLIPLVHDFVSLIDSMGYPYLFREYHEGHSWGNWRAHVDNALEYFFPAKPSQAAIGNTGAGEFNLDQNYPNPANPTTNISFSIPRAQRVSLLIYDLLGKVVFRLLEGDFSEGKHVVQFDSRNLASGIYFYTLAGPGGRAARRMIVIR